jgi:branched-chain amino acid transport system permease protein
MAVAVEILLGGVFAGAVFALVALGFALVFRVSGVLNLSQGAFVVLGALSLESLEARLHWPLWAAFAGSTLIAAAVGAVIEVLAVRPARRRLSTSGLLILTAGLLTALEGASLLVWGSQPYAIPTFSGEQPLSLLGVRVPRQDLWIGGATLVIVLLLWLLLTRTHQGKALRASAENPTAASLMGVDVARMSLVAFVAGAVLGAVAGMVAGPTVSLQFDSGSFFTNTGYIAVALGGMDSFLGSVIGGLGLGVVQQLGAGYVSSLFADSLVFLVLLAVLVWRPSGLLGRARGREDVATGAARLTPPVRLRGRSAWVVPGVLAVLVAAAPWLPGGQDLLQGLVITGVFFIAVLGLDVLMGFGGQVSLGHAGFMAIGAYATAILTVRYQRSPLLGLAAGLVASLLVALVLAVVTARLRGLYMALATLAFGLLVDSVTVGATGLTGGPSGLAGVPAFGVGGVVFADPTANYYLVWGVAAVGFLVVSNLTRGRFGRNLRALRADQTAARALGIRVPRHKASALLLSAVYASVAGSLYACDFHFLSPEMVNTSSSLEMVTMLVVGGQGTLLGPLFGSALLTMLPTVFQPLSLYKTVAEGLLLVAVLLYAPRGILGLLDRALGVRPSRRRVGLSAEEAGPA